MKILRPFVEFARWARGAARRSITSLPWIAGGSSPSQVNGERALSLVPFFACVRLLADQVSSLPLHAYRKVGDARMPVRDPALFRQPAAIGTQVRWLRQLVISLAMRGNAYGLVTARDGLGFPTAVEWLNPDEVYCDDTRPTLPIYYWLGNKIERREDVVHVPWFVEPGRVKGLSPISAFAQTIGVGLKAVDFGAKWFENGGTPPGTFRNTQKEVPQDVAEVVSDRVTASVRRGRPLVFGADWEWESLKVSPEESQFIQTSRMNATQIAAIFGVPPEMVGGESGGSLTYNNPEMNGLSFLKFTLRPWLTLIESELSRLLPAEQFALFNADAVVRADTTSRYAAHAVALHPDTGWLSVDEVRAMEDLPPVGGNANLVRSAQPREPEPAPGVPDDARELTGESS